MIVVTKMQEGLSLVHRPLPGFQWLTKTITRIGVETKLHVGRVRMWYGTNRTGIFLRVAVSAQRKGGTMLNHRKFKHFP